MNRTRAYGRWQRRRTIRRKQCLLRRIGGASYEQAWSRGISGRLAEQKIHCSCALCRKKWRQRPSHSDRKKLLAFEPENLA